MAHSHSIKEYPGQMAGIMAMSAALGAGLAMLFAPKTGIETRRAIRERAAYMKGKLQRTSDKSGEAMGATKDTMKSSATKLKDVASKPARTVRRSRKQTGNPDMTDEIRRNGEP